MAAGFRGIIVTVRDRLLDDPVDDDGQVGRQEAEDGPPGLRVGHVPDEKTHVRMVRIAFVIDPPIDRRRSSTGDLLDLLDRGELVVEQVADNGAEHGATISTVWTDREAGPRIRQCTGS